jgi:hypothetical protein
MKRIFPIVAILVFCLTAPETRVGGQIPSAETSIPFRFVSWGDTRGSTSGVNTAVLSSLSNQADQLFPTFSLLAGDLCYSFDGVCTSLDSSGWMYAVNGGNNPGNGMFNITFVTRGNHDTGPGLGAWQGFFDMQGVASLVGASNFSAQTEDATYSFDYSNSHFVSVDVPGDVNIISTAQILSLDADLTSAEARGVTHTFLFWHGPIYCVDGHCSYTSVQGSAAPAALVAVLNNHPSITATFHGHEHVNTYTHLDSTRITGLTHPFEQFVTGEAGAPPNSCDKVNRFSYCTNLPGFVTVDVNGYEVTVSQFHRGGGTTPARPWTFPKAAPAVTRAPGPLTFSSQNVGTTSPPQSVTVTNSGTVELVFNSTPVISGDFAFADAGTCGSTLALGASCVLNVNFTPTAAGTRTGTVSLNDNAPDSPQTIPLSGTGFAPTPTVRVSPTSLNFGKVKIGTTSAPRTVTVANTGNSPVVILSVASTGPFAQTNNCPGSLPVAASCAMSVTFAPKAAGAVTGRLTITDNAVGSPQVVTLSGQGSKK